MFEITYNGHAYPYLKNSRPFNFANSAIHFIGKTFHSKLTPF